jgi:hypothetical protein
MIVPVRIYGLFRELRILPAQLLRDSVSGLRNLCATPRAFRFTKLRSAISCEANARATEKHFALAENIFGGQFVSGPTNAQTNQPDAAATKVVSNWFKKVRSQCLPNFKGLGILGWL